MLDLTTITKVIVSNWRRTGNPVGVPVEKLVKPVTTSSEGGGPRALLYTGLLYPMSPYMEGFVSLTERVERTPLHRLAKLGAGLGGLLGRVVYSRAVGDKVRRVLANAYNLLRAQGYEPVVLDNEPYSGVLFYDLGLMREFQEQAEAVVKTFEEAGVDLVVTIDPHTTMALRDVYPRFTKPGFKVKHILEVVDTRGLERLSGGVFAADETPVIHDPCLMSRGVRLDLRLREYLSSLGLEFKEPVLSKDRTFCCGGPVESIAPGLSRAISCRRVSQLIKESGVCVTACPICLINLSRGCGGNKLRVIDYLELLGGGHG